MNTVTYSSCFVPCEWIAAHGLKPQRIAPRSTVVASHLTSEGICPYARAFVATVLREHTDDVVVMTTVCDQMRRAFDLLDSDFVGSKFLLHVPKAQRSPEGRYYLSELERLGSFLVELGGTTPSDRELAATMRTCEAVRSEIRQARDCLPARRYSELLLEASTGQRTAPDRSNGPGRSGAIPLAILGGPLVAEDYELFDWIAQAGGQVVLDATDSGERTLPGSFDLASAEARPLDALAHAYFREIPHVCRRPNDSLYEYLQEQFAVRKVQAAIFRHYPWCDLWNAELRCFQERLNVPVLELSLGSEGQDRSRAALRVQALLETLL